MEMTRIKKALSSALCIVLITATALFTLGCNDNKEQNSGENTTVQTTVQSDTGEKSDVKVLGEGQTQFDFTVTDADGKETAFVIHTDKEVVGEALIELELIDGEQGDYGMYVKTVNGLTVDYDSDGKYWAFYVNGEYATSGVDTTKIVEGETYSFKVE